MDAYRPSATEEYRLAEWVSYVLNKLVAFTAHHGLSFNITDVQDYTPQSPFLKIANRQLANRISLLYHHHNSLITTY